MRLTLHINGNVVVKFQGRTRELKNLKQEVIEKEAVITQLEDRIGNLERQRKRVEQESVRLEQEILMVNLQRTKITGTVEEERQQRETQKNFSQKTAEPFLQEQNEVARDHEIKGKAFRKSARTQSIATSILSSRCISKEPAVPKSSRRNRWSLNIPKQEQVQDKSHQIDHSLLEEDVGNQFYRDVPEFDSEEAYRSALLNLVNIQDDYYQS